MGDESDFLKWIAHQPLTSANLLVPPGDDLAVLRWSAGDLLLVGVDQVLDGVHFDSAHHGPEAIGRKAMNRNLSDCAAMGCLPVAAVVSAALPAGCGLRYAQQLHSGLKWAGDAFGCAIVGGDTGSWSGRLALSVAIFGKNDGVSPITRRGAVSGDGLYVTGPLGGSLIGRHMTFTPRVNEGRILAASGLIHSMIDLSDGLSHDLPRLLRETGLGAAIRSDWLPIHPDAFIDRHDGLNALEHALHDGEDYELLFTSPSVPPLGHRIGTITDRPGIELIEAGGKVTALPPAGWNHRL